MSVIYAFIDRAFKKKFFEADEAIYSKLLDAMFKMSEDEHDVFSKLIPRMRGFHLICACSKQFSRDLKILESLCYLFTLE